MKTYCRLLLWLVIVLGPSVVTAQETAIKLNIGDPAPAIKVAKWLKGSSVNGFEKGKVYVVEFWATWCMPCIAGMPHLSELAAKYKNDVTVSGISVWERKTTSPTRVANFVDSMGSKMAYNVAADDSSFMGDSWLKASGTRGIPAAFVIDKNSKLAWIGLPKKLDEVLPKVINGSWDAAKFGASLKEQVRLSQIDNFDVVNRLNPYMGNPGKPDSALTVIEQILAKEPGLKYYPKLGHFTLFALIKTNQVKALDFGKAWLAASEEPNYKSITDAVYYMTEVKKVPLSQGLYELAAYSYQAQIDNYPWSMNMPVTYNDIARLQFLAGNKEKAIEAQAKAIAEAKKKEKFPADQLAKFEASLQEYKEM